MKNFSKLLNLPISPSSEHEIHNLFDLHYYAKCFKLQGNQSAHNEQQIKWFQMRYDKNCVIQNIENTSELWPWIAFLHNNYKKNNKNLEASIVKHFDTWCRNHLPNDESLFFFSQKCMMICIKE